ncbi:ABC transporter permease [Holzapfeliella floricola]|nr:ABC transporter permease [Holzapfeliella floricola]
MSKNWKSRLSIPLISILAGFVLGAIIMLCLGYDPIMTYEALFTGAWGDPNSIGETLRQATPLILTGLGFSVATSAGFFNIGGAGQYLVGWLSSIWFVLSFPSLPGVVLITGAIAAGAIAGGIWSGIAGVLRAYLKTNEVITTIMLNYIALYLSNWIVKSFLANGDADYSKSIPQSASLRSPFLMELTNNSTFHYGLFIAIVIAIIMAFVMKKTTVGYEIRSIGLNSDASKYAGMSTKKVIILAMTLSGLLAGIGGAVDGIGNYQNILVLASTPSVGFDGLAVALLAYGNPIGIVFASLLFASLKIGGLNIPVVSNTPSEIVDIVIALIIFFVGASYLFEYISKKMKTNKSKGGKA